MSDVMMKALQLQVESLTRQVSQLGPENERVRKLLTEFDQRHGADQDRISALEAALEQADVLAELVKDCTETITEFQTEWDVTAAHTLTAYRQARDATR